MKPDNVLTFEERDVEVQFVAQLSDFGNCIDMQTRQDKPTIEDYLSTLLRTGSRLRWPNTRLSRNLGWAHFRRR